jgi:IPT/TIG domain
MRARPLALVLALLFVSLAHAQTPPPPAISTILPATGGIGTSVTITGSNFGSTQAQSVVTFNGISARVTTWSDTSIVAKAPRGLSPGSATIIVAVSQTASNGVQYTVTQPLFVTPNQATLHVGDTRSMQLIDENGALIGNSVWTFDDTSIAEIIPPQNPGDPTLLQADAVGATDFIASVGDRTGIATITVLPAGAAFPVGTVQWSVPPLGSFGFSKTIQSVRIDENTPDLYAEDDGAYGGNGSIRGLTADGQHKWIWPSTNQDKFPLLVAADNQGGALYFANQDTPNQFGSYCYFGRVDENGNESWQYQETNCSEDYAIAPDGTIFLVEDAFQNSAATVITALDPSTGQVKFTVPLPAASQVTTGADATEGLDPNRPSGLSYCTPGTSGSTVTSTSSIHGSISISSDGTVLIPFTTSSDVTDAEPCDSSPDPSFPGYPHVVQPTDGSWSSSGTLQLMSIHPDGSTSVQQLDANSSSGTGQTPGQQVGFFGMGRAISDGQGGALLTISSPPSLYHASTSGVSKFGLPITPDAPPGDDLYLSDSMLLGEDGSAYITGSSTPEAPVDTVLAIDSNTGATKWTASPGLHPKLSTAASDASLALQYELPDLSVHSALADSSGHVSPLFANPDNSDAGPVIASTFGLHLPSYMTPGAWYTFLPDLSIAAITGPHSGAGSEIAGSPWVSGGGEPQRHHVANPTASITVNFTGSKSPNDQLNFSGAGECPTENLGLWYCPKLSWSFYIEGAATVSDDASKWRVKQHAVIKRSGNTKDSQGILHPFSDNFDSSSIPGDDDPCVLNDSRPGCLDIVSVQQPAGQKAIFWLDHPGSLYQASSDAIWDSLDENGQFTSRVCNRFGICTKVSWFILLVVDPGSHLDFAQSFDGFGPGPSP